MNVDKYGRNMNLAVEKIFGQIRLFVEWWESEKLKVPVESENEEVRSEGLFGSKRITTVVEWS